MQSQHLHRFGFELYVVRVLHQDRAADQLIVCSLSDVGGRKDLRNAVLNPTNCDLVLAELLESPKDTAKCSLIM